jgi:hypothetical protein
LIEEKPLSKLPLELEESGLDLFDEDAQFNTRRHAYFVGRGFPFLKWLSTLKDNERVHVIAKHSMAECNSSISRILSGGNTSPDSSNDDQERTHGDGTANLATIGWTWAERNKLTLMPHD